MSPRPSRPFSRNPAGRKAVRGGVLFSVVVMALVITLLTAIMSNLGVIAGLSGRLLDASAKDRMNGAVVGAIWADARTELANAGSFAAADNGAAVRRARITGLLSVPAGNLGAPGYQPALVFGDLGTTLFAKANALAPSPAGAVHPLLACAGFSHRQTISGTASPSPRIRSADFSFVLGLREVPVTEVGFYCTDSYLAGSTNVALTVNGTAVFPRGFVGGDGAPVLAASTLVATSGAVGGLVTSDRSFVSPLYQTTLGVEPATVLFAPANLVGVAASQGYFDQATAVASVVAGTLYNAPAGVVLRPFPGPTGPKRVVVTLNSLTGVGTRLFVAFASAADRANGVVVIGDGGTPAGSNKSVVSNGALWLWGNNTQAALVGTNYGAVRLNDGTWNETGPAPGQPPLNLAWTGHIAAVGPTVWTSSQDGDSSQLVVNGSLLTGQPSGSGVGAITVNQVTGSNLQNQAARFLFAASVR